MLIEVRSVQKRSCFKKKKNLVQPGYIIPSNFGALYKIYKSKQRIANKTHHHAQLFSYTVDRLHWSRDSMQKLK